MSSPTPIITPPPVRPKSAPDAAPRWNFHGIAKRLSTALTLVATSAQAAGLYFIAAPVEWKSNFPPVAGFVLLGAGILATALVPIATSFQQKPQ